MEGEAGPTIPRDTIGSSGPHTKETSGKNQSRGARQGQPGDGRTFPPLPRAAAVGGRGDQSRGSGGWAGRCPRGRGELLRK